MERSQNAMRPSLPRIADTGPMPKAADDRSRHRDPSGRFKAGNPGGLGRGQTAPIRRLLGHDSTITDAETRVVAADAARVFAGVIAELPNTGATVRQLVGLYARHVALAGFWTSRANAAGVGSEEGAKASENSIRHDTRAERLAASYLHASKALAGATKPEAYDYDKLFGGAK